MCGRYELHSSPAAIALAFDLAQPPDIGGRYNIAPTQRVPVVCTNAAGNRELAQLRFGLVPFRAKDISIIGHKMINARGETVASKPGFRDCFRKARCLLPADGFCERAKLARGGKQPMHIDMRDGNPVGLAGLWARWHPREGI